MELGLAGRCAAVAASTAGLGLASAQALVDEGARVAVCSSDPRRVAAAVDRLGDRAVGITADLSSPDACEQFVLDARAALGGLDILVANGPGPPPGTFATAPVAGYQQALELNLLSVVRMCHAAVPEMRACGWGRVVAITSIAVRQPIADLILSNTARAGATGFLKTLAREIAGDGVTVNSVLPGLHRTGRVTSVYGAGLDAQAARIPSGTLGDPEHFGRIVAFLCSEQAAYITGAAIPVDGGLDQALL